MHYFDFEDRTAGRDTPPLLQVDATWPLPPDPQFNPLRGRALVEIYNMPEFMAGQVPPLLPPPGRTRVLYTYVSGVPADAGHVYPATADGQPVFMLTKSSPQDTQFRRALCSFEPWRLTFHSHLELADFILLRTMHLGEPEAQ